jgi:hypothetical protein
MKLAVTAAAAVNVMVQVPVPVQAPPQPENMAPEAGVSVNVTWLPCGKFAVQLLPQLIPAGLLVTAPGPESDTATGYVGTPLEVKVAVSETPALTVTAQLFEVPQPLPVQPWNEYPVPATAFTVTCVPLVKVAEQAPGQLIPAGLLVTLPVPTTCTVRG